MPVIYVPQGLGSTLSQLAMFCVNGAHHTKAVLRQLHTLKELTEPAHVSQRFNCPVPTNYSLNLENTDSLGEVVASYSIPAIHARQLLQHVGFNNIPFDHSSAVLDILLNLFYPTDNQHQGEQLGYYRQREWRLIASDVHFNGHRMGRELSQEEKQELANVNPSFWNHQLLIDGKSTPRLDLTLVYDPVPGWDVFDSVNSIYAPEGLHNRISEIVGGQVPIYIQP